MSESLALTLAVYSGGLAAYAAVGAAIGSGVSRGLAGGAVIVEFGALAQAIAASIGLAGGHDVSEGGVLAAYLAASVLILPLLWPLAAEDHAPWGRATIAIGLVAIAVISLRALDVWQG